MKKTSSKKSRDTVLLIYFSAGDGAAASRLWAACLGVPAVPLVSFTHGTSSPGSPPQNICSSLTAEKIKVSDERILYIQKLVYIYEICKEMQMRGVAKSYMRKGFLHSKAGPHRIGIHNTSKGMNRYFLRI